MSILRFRRYSQASAESEHDHNYGNYILSLDGTVGEFDLFPPQPYLGFFIVYLHWATDFNGTITIQSITVCCAKFVFLFTIC